MQKTRLQIARKDILELFDKLPKNVFQYTEIEGIISKNRSHWRLAQRTNTRDFIEFLCKNGRLKPLEFPFPNRSETRYIWGSAHFLEVLLTLKPDAYLSHYTALYLHGLTEQIPKTIYVNHEQSSPGEHYPLEQSQIDQAFSRPVRESQNFVNVNGERIYLLNGMNTGELGIEESTVSYKDSSEAVVRLTNLERTLIDITIRPVYSGGVSEVMKAFHNAREAVSVNVMASMVAKLNFSYPYHQCLGFYLERAGYKSSLIDLMRKKFPIKHDFYLIHEMAETDYVKDWRLFIPKGL